MKMVKPRLLIINPAYNPTEKELLSYQAVSDEIHALLTEFFEVAFIIVDDGSKQKIISSTTEIIRLDHNKGKGNAIKKAIKTLQNVDYVVYTDFDFPYTKVSLQDIAKKLISDEMPDLVLSERDETYFKRQPLQRRLISKVLQRVNRHLLGIKHFDTQAGLKGMRVGKATDILKAVRIDGFLFEIEFIMKAERMGLHISTVKVDLKEEIEIIPVSLKTIINNAKVMFGLVLAKIFPGGTDQ